MVETNHPLTMQVHYHEHVLVHWLDQRCLWPLGMTRALQPHLKVLEFQPLSISFLVSNSVPLCLHFCHLFPGLMSSSVSAVYFSTRCTPGQNKGTPGELNYTYILSLVNMLSWQLSEFYDSYKNLIRPFCHMRWTLYCHFLFVEKISIYLLVKIAFGKTS